MANGQRNRERVCIRYSWSNGTMALLLLFNLLRKTCKIQWQLWPFTPNRLIRLLRVQSVVMHCPPVCKIYFRQQGP